MIKFRSISLLTLFLLIACSSSSDQPTPSPGEGGSSSGGSGGQSGFSGSAGKVVEPEGGAPSDGGAAGEGEVGGSPDAGQGGEAGAEEAGAGGEGGVSFEDPDDDCVLPGYLKAQHEYPRTLGAPVVTELIPTNPSGTVPLDTIVKYSNKNGWWRCAHSPFCNYAVHSPSLIPLPVTEKYWDPIYWQGAPPDGHVGDWVNVCTLGDWKYHGTCGGFYLSGDLVNYKDPDDLYAERYVWSCRSGWDLACGTQEPGTGSAWENVSSTYQCYGYTAP